MTTIISIKTTAIKTLSLLFIVTAAFACSNANTPNKDVANQTETVAAESVTIQGIVKAITNGKDGYTAEVQTDKDGVYFALVSISNVGGPDNYKSCEVTDNVTFKGVSSTSNGVKHLMVKQIVDISPSHTEILIDSKGFRGIEVGDAIAKHKDYLNKTTLKTGEGSFTVYEIRDFENNPAGYLMADPNNKLLVGDITVESKRASTAQGIKIGDTFKDLLRVFPNIEVNGSESEGHTYATANNLSYRLNIPNFKYDVDKSKIPATTKITQIIVNRSTGK